MTPEDLRDEFLDDMAFDQRNWSAVARRCASDRLDAIIGHLLQENSVGWARDLEAARKEFETTLVNVTVARAEAPTVEALAKALHRDCEDEWDRKSARDPGWEGTLHGWDAHTDRAGRLVAALAEKAADVPEPPALTAQQRYDRGILPSGRAAGWMQPDDRDP